MRQTWSDERLDDLNGRVSDGFQRVDAEMRAIRTGMREEFAAVRGEMNARFDATQRLILQVGGGMTAAMVAGFLGVLAAVL